MCRRFFKADAELARTDDMRPPMRSRAVSNARRYFERRWDQGVLRDARARDKVSRLYVVRLQERDNIIA
jgi:hypothetical protein